MGSKALTKIPTIIIILVIIIGVIGSIVVLNNILQVPTTPTISTSPTSSTTPISTSPTTTSPIRTTTPSIEEGISITDFRGRVITLSKPADRIVVLSSYWVEILVALGAADKIIGIGSYVPYDDYLPPSIKNKIVVGSVFKGVNIEQIAALNPDIVIMDCGYSKADEIIEQIENLGIPVIGLFMKSINDEIKAIDILGRIIGAEDRAEALKEFIITKYQYLTSKPSTIPEDQRLHVVMISGSSILKEGQLTVYANTSWGKSIEDIGGINIALREFPNEKWAKIDFETLAAWDPDVIIITSSVSKIQETLDKIESDSKWHILKAYKENKIYVVPCWSSIGGVLDWGPRDIIGREYLAKVIYPDVYSDIDWRNDMEHLLKEFYGVFIPKQAFAIYNIKWKEIIDMTNTEVKIPRKVERVVDLITYETLIAFNVMDKLVGVSKYAKKNILVKTAYPNITNIPSPGSSFSLNIEELSSLNPDIVIIWPYKPEVVEQIETLGIPVIRISLYSYEDIERLLWLIGTIFDKNDRAKELISDMNSIVDLVQDRIKDIPEDMRIKVLYLWSKPTKVQGGKGTVNDFIVLAGGINIAAEDLPDKTYVNVDLETIIKWNPDMIVIWYYAKYNETIILNDPAWASITAIKNGKIYKEPYYEHWNMDAVLFILWLAQKMYPDRFSDIDFINIANEHYMKWYGVTYTQVVGD